jgi:hypothetical protein
VGGGQGQTDDVDGSQQEGKRLGEEGAAQSQHEDVHGKVDGAEAAGHHGEGGREQGADQYGSGERPHAGRREYGLAKGHQRKQKCQDQQGERPEHRRDEPVQGDADHYGEEGDHDHGAPDQRPPASLPVQFGEPLAEFLEEQPALCSPVAVLTFLV